MSYAAASPATPPTPPIPDVVQRLMRSDEPSIRLQVVICSAGHRMST